MNYVKTDYSKVEKQIKGHRELVITRHFSQRMAERGIRYQDLKRSLKEPVVIRHEGSYDNYGNLRIKYTLQSQDRYQDDIGIICAVTDKEKVILITVMYFNEEIGWERQSDGLYVKK